MKINKTQKIDPRSLITIENSVIKINENDLDLFDLPDYELPTWEPKKELKAYSELKTVYFDIETTGGIERNEYGKQYVDYKNHAIELIGLYNESGTGIIINCMSKTIDRDLLIEKLNTDTPGKYSEKNVYVVNAGTERQGIVKFLEILQKKQPDILTGFNNFFFDLPFLIGRMEIYKIRNNFWVNPRQTVFSSAQKFGEPSIYNSIWLNTYPEKGLTAIIDLYHQTLAWDFVARKLTSHSLKQAVLQMDLRETQRLELSYEQMREVVNQGELETYAQYLFYDIEDTKLLGDFLIPSVYYQKLFLPDWKLQSISHSGNGSKWNSILEKYYESKGIRVHPETDEKLKFQGGLTGANKGVYRNVSKIDVASLYPNIMLTYMIYNIKKDVDAYQLVLLKYLLNFRLSLKEKKKLKTATSEEKRTEGAYKVIINSGYGSFGTRGISYNDYVAGALVTAYGRKILRYMMSLIESMGGVIASLDTDGIMFATDDPTFEKNKKIHEYVNSKMPPGINLDYELEAICFYVPPNLKKISNDLVDGTDELQDGIRNDGLRKNYIIIGLKGEIKSKGKYNKRDRCMLEKTFQPNLIKALSESDVKAYEYYSDIIDQLKNKTFSIDNFKITRKIRKGEKEMIENGFGKQGDQITYYFAEPQEIIGKRGKPLKHKKMIKTVDGDPGWEYYIELVEKMYQEIMDVVVV